mmetsp:Transcript_50779/g.145738  ORF Transcript_50779/g.145738 Transcript_50779/m.145738 type:complete len:212 (+) Transcript_50779:37-672(+)
MGVFDLHVPQRASALRNCPSFRAPPIASPHQTTGQKCTGPTSRSARRLTRKRHTPGHRPSPTWIKPSPPERASWAARRTAASSRARGAASPSRKVPLGAQTRSSPAARACPSRFRTGHSPARTASRHPPLPHSPSPGPARRRPCVAGCKPPRGPPAAGAPAPSRPAARSRWSQARCSLRCAAARGRSSWRGPERPRSRTPWPSPRPSRRFG